MDSSGLPEGVPAWLADVGAGRIVRLERHVARREAWVVDIERADGSVLEGFLRLERDPVADDPWSLGKETRIVQALAGTAVPVPEVLARSDDPSLTLFERVPGRADLPAVGERQQRAVMGGFIDIVVALHQLDPAQLVLGELVWPTTPEAYALGEIDLLVDRWRGFLSTYHEPLLSFGLRWLRHHVPRAPERPALLQGDTGPVNFLFEGDRVTAVIDWEWGHLGDPMEDLGNICVREFWNPSGGLAGLFHRYAERSGTPYRPEAVRYYRVQQNLRGMIPIHALTVRARPAGPLAWYLAYRYVGDRATCEALAEAIGIEVPRPVLPADDDSAGSVAPGPGTGPEDQLLEAARFALERDVAPAVDAPFAQSRLGDARRLLDCATRLRRHGPAIARQELDELAELLGHRPGTLAEGLAELDHRITTEQIDEVPLVIYLTRRARRHEWLWSPVADLYPDRHWSPIDEVAATTLASSGQIAGGAGTGA